jgi:hypothetical protein
MRHVLAVCFFISAVSGLGCHNKPAEGPAEKAGAKVDNAAEKTKDAAKDATSDVKKKTDDK